MSDLVTFTAGAIARFAFHEFLKSGIGELSKRFSADAISKMGELRKVIWHRLQAKSSVAETALKQAQNGNEQAIESVATFLGVEMLSDPEFAQQVQIMAREIQTGKLLDHSTMTQNISDSAKGWQTKVEGGTAYIGEIHLTEKSNNS